LLCNICGKNEATIHLTEIINGQMVELHLCENCSQEKGSEMKTQFSLNDLLAGLTDLNNLAGGQRKEELICQGCGLTYQEFGRTGRLGCPGCYQSFSKLLLPLIKRVQKGTQHVGKRPSKVAPEVRTHMDLRDLQERLRKSVQLEEFEEAARIRDQIKQLETKMKRGSRKGEES